jgi:hypothetical protein
LPLDQRFAGLNPGKSKEFLMAIKICMNSFGGEVKLFVPCHEILWRVKDPYSMKDILVQKNSCLFLAKFLLLCYQVFLLVTARELRWVNQE